jgi:hypothetical protein
MTARQEPGGGREEGSRTPRVSPQADVLLALAARCEAEEPSRELDTAIVLAAFDLEPRPYSAGKRVLWYFKRGTDSVMFYGERSILAYTTSLDAAVTLVPESHVWRVGSGGCNGGYACTVGVGTGQPYGNGENRWAKTAALALCAAALRARAALAEQTQASHRASEGNTKSSVGRAGEGEVT